MLRRPTTWSAWINIGNGKGSSPWVRQQADNMQAIGPCDPDVLNPKSTGFDILSRTSYMCQVLKSFLPIRGFLFIVLAYASIHPSTYMYIHHDKVIAVSVPPYYVVGANNNNNNNNNKCVREVATICPAPAS